MIEPDRGRRLLRLWLRQAPPEARRFPNVFAERGLKSKDQMAVVWRRTSDPVRQRVVFPRSTNPVSSGPAALRRIGARRFSQRTSIRVPRKVQRLLTTLWNL